MAELTLFNLKVALTPQTPGWLRQVRMATLMRDNMPSMRSRIAALSETLSAVAAGKQALTVAQIDMMTEVILEFVLLPADKSQARELIWDKSCEELARMIEEITASLS